MKTRIAILFTAILSTLGILQAQDITTVEATSSDISYNLDLEAVAAIFGEAEDLEDFEFKLNDPELRISNLDLNRDGMVDYLRVVEHTENRTHLIVIQAVLAMDQFQDVATIDVEQDNSGSTRVQVVGDVYMYGPDYIIEPAYVHRPVIFSFFWGAHYRPWHSPYHWAYFPHHFHYWNVHPVHVYHTTVWTHVRPSCHFYYRSTRYSHTAYTIHHRTHRNDYARQNPHRSFAHRNSGVRNSRELGSYGATASTVGSRSSHRKVNYGNKQINNDVKKNNPNIKTKGNGLGDRSVAGNSRPGTSTKPSTKPASTGNKYSTNNRPAARPANGKASNSVSNRPSARPANSSKGKQIASTKPSSRPTYSSGKANANRPAARPTTSSRGTNANSKPTARPTSSSRGTKANSKPAARPTTRPSAGKSASSGTYKPSSKPTSKSGGSKYSSPSRTTNTGSRAGSSKSYSSSKSTNASRNKPSSAKSSSRSNTISGKSPSRAPQKSVKSKNNSKQKSTRANSGRTSVQKKGGR